MWVTQKKRQLDEVDITPPEHTHAKLMYEECDQRQNYEAFPCIILKNCFTKCHPHIEENQSSYDGAQRVYALIDTHYWDRWARAHTQQFVQVHNWLSPDTNFPPLITIKIVTLVFMHHKHTHTELRMARLFVVVVLTKVLWMEEDYVQLDLWAGRSRSSPATGLMGPFCCRF